MAMKRRDVMQQQTIQVNKYRQENGMSALPVTESDRAQSAPIPRRAKSVEMKQIKNVGKVKARLMSNALLARLYPSTTGEARRSIKAEMSRRGKSYQDILEKSKIA